MTSIYVPIDDPGFGEWVYGGTQETPTQPSAGTFRRNAANTRVDIAHASQRGLDISSHLGRCVGGALYLRSGGQDRLYTISAITNNGAWSSLTVALNDDSTSFALTTGNTYSIAAQVGTSTAIAVVDETTPLTSALKKLTFTGDGITATEPGADGEITVTVGGGTSPVPSVFGRVGPILAMAGDYSASKVVNDSGVPGSGAYVSNALSALYGLNSTAQTTASTALSNAATAQATADNAKNKTDFLSVSQPVDLDQVETDTVLNNAKVSYTDASLVSTLNGKLANVTTITPAGAELINDTDAAAQRATLQLGSAATLKANNTIGNLPLLENVGGDAALPALNGSQLYGLPTGGSQIAFYDIDTDPVTPLTPDMSVLKVTGSGVTVTEPSPNEITLTITGGTGGSIDITDNTTTVSAADLLRFNPTTFDVLDQGNNDAQINMVFGTSAGTVAQGNHTHLTLADVAGGTGGTDGRILGRITAGQGLSEELTQAQVLAFLGGVEAGATQDQTAGEIEAIVSHDNLLDYVANEHIDWTAASAGTIDPTNVPAATTTTLGIVELADDGESAANKVVQGNDARMSNARTPTTHTHTFGQVTGLSSPSFLGRYSAGTGNAQTMDPETARGVMGLGDAATKTVGTAVGNVAGIVDVGGGTPGFAAGLDGRNIENLVPTTLPGLNSILTDLGTGGGLRNIMLGPESLKDATTPDQYGRFFFTTDTGKFYFDSGVPDPGWVDVIVAISGSKVAKYIQTAEPTAEWQDGDIWIEMPVA